MALIDSKANIHHCAGIVQALCGDIMLTQTVTARGQVTLRKEVLQHLGIGPGEKIELDLLPDGRGVMRAARQTGTMA